MLEEIAEVLGLHMARQDKASRLVQCARCVENDGPKSSAVSRNHDVDGGRHVCRSQKALEPYMNFPADDRNPHSVRYAQIQKRDCEVISSAGIERPGESERALTCIASESAGQEDAQRARIVLPEGTDVPSPSWPAGLAGRHSFAALSTACLRGPIRKHQGVVRFASS